MGDILATKPLKTRQVPKSRSHCIVVTIQWRLPLPNRDGQNFTPVVSLSREHHAGDGRKPWEWSGTFNIPSPSTNHTRGLAARRLFIVPPCRKGTIHLQTSMSSPGFEPSPYGIAVSVANRYAGWATLDFVNYINEKGLHRSNMCSFSFVFVLAVLNRGPRNSSRQRAKLNACH
ncbi:hypothetical protein TNCV_4963001 [Trichonephila clavipes]|nr:hypothetical protein TNCV_4963001 [Trichonephila clavipes]